MTRHGKPSYRTSKSLRKDSDSKSPRPRYRTESSQRAKDIVIIDGNALPFGEQRRTPEFGNHNSGIGPELSLVFCKRTLIFSERFQTSRRSVWYKW
jgi:hypothetical protein